MIGFIEGVVRAVRGGTVLITTGGIGYCVMATKEAIAKLKEGKPVSLWTHLAVREDALDLYGFANEEDLRFFELLLTVPGIGPKSALAILNIAAVKTLRSAIASGNATYMTKVSGIGKKTAEKIVLELREKVGKEEHGAALTLRGDEEALEALRALGYSAEEARDALRKIPSATSGSNARLREALRLLGQ